MTSAITIWVFDLDLPDETRAAFEPQLSDAERERRAQLRRPVDRQRFTVVRAAVRQILGAETGQPPQSLVFIPGAYGKPSLPGEGCPGFSISHSGEIGVLGVGGGTAFGVDIEKIVPIEPGVADIAFSGSERAELADGSPDEWLSRFYRSWTRREAIGKGLGSGLAQPFELSDVTDDPQAMPRLVRVTGPPGPVTLWELFHFEPATGYSGAVAVAAPGHSIVLKRWTPSTA